VHGGMKERMRIDKQPLSEREQRALAWVRTHYPEWRRRLSEPLETYLARRPAWVPTACWSRWYEAPFRDGVLNEHVRLVRRLLRESGAKAAMAPARPAPSSHRSGSEAFRSPLTGIENA